MLNLDAIFLNWLLAFPFFAALMAAVFPHFSLRPHSEAEAESLPRAPFALGALACLMGVSLSVSLLPAALRGEGAAADYWWTRELYQLRFRADGFSVAEAMAFYLVGFLANLHLYGLPTPSHPQWRAAALLAATGCAAAAVLSADLVAMIFFLGLALLGLWLLASLDAPQGADRMLVMGYGGVLLVVGGVMVMWRQTAGTSTEGLPLLLLTAPPAVLRLVGVLVLLGTIPLLAAAPAHSWLRTLLQGDPRTALLVATVLAPLAMGTALRLLPGALSLSQVPGLATLGLALGLLSLWWGALLTRMARSMGRAVGWLVTAQAGQFLVALGVAANPTATAAAQQVALAVPVIHAVAAPLALLALWSATSSVLGRVGTDALAGLSGLGRRLPLSGAAFLLGGLSLAGVPPLPGFWSQGPLLGALLREGRWPLGALVLAADVLLAVGVLSVFRKAFLREREAPPLQPARRWLSPQVGMAGAALIVLAVMAGPLREWGGAVAAHVLSLTP
jgi:formate hydrogenlyase subunit 3/multisubunit Na+/H+ antiporter MnhD subunit